MKRTAAIATVVGLAATCIVLLPAAPVAADDNCEHVIPVGSLDDEAVVATGASGALLVGPPGPVAVGGATAAVTLTAGTVALSAAAFVGAVLGTCTLLDNTPIGSGVVSVADTFFDWVTGDGDQMEDVELTGVGTDRTFAGFVERNAMTSYPTSTWWASSGSNFLVALLTTSDVSTPTSARISHNAQCAIYVDGVTIPVTPSSSLYQVPGSPASKCTNYATNAYWPQGCFTRNSGSGYSTSGDHYCDYSTGTITQIGFAFDNLSLADGDGIGGNHGLHPRTLVVAATANAHLESYDASAHWISALNPEARDKGWTRRIVTDVRCTDAGEAHTWVRAMSDVYWDREVSQRIPVPQCANVDEMPTLIRVQRVPTGVTCSIGNVCYGDANIIVQYTLPNSLIATATAPDWSTCLTRDGECGIPEGDTETCMWGGISVPGDFCDPATQAGNPTTNPTTVPVTVGTLEPPPHEVGTPTSTATATEPPPEEPPEGTITVPIEPGSGPRGSGYVPDDEEAECWPDGWGWMNPAEWVLKPIKCALLWAFVPDGDAIASAFEGFQEELEAQFPFSMVFLLVDFLDELGTSLDGASGDGCFDTGGSFSFGDAGSVPVEDVCVGGALTIGSTTRQLLAVLIIAPMTFTLLSHARATLFGSKAVASP